MTSAIHRRSRLRLAVLVLGLLWLGLVMPTGVSADEHALSHELEAGPETPSDERDVEDLALLAGFYRERAMAPLWTDETGATGRARALASVLGAADADGLDPSDYHADAIAALLGARRADLLAELELRLSLGLMRFVADLAAGRLEPHRVDPELFIEPEAIDRATVLREAAGADDITTFVAAFRPRQDEYRRLQAALADHRELAAAGGWGTVLEGPTLDPGMRDGRVADLRRRLQRSGDLVAETLPEADPELYDDALAETVRRFQARHGLDRDGRVGARTVAALNVPVEDRIRQILLNLERRRWMPDDRGARYVMVNLADFELKVVDRLKTVLAERVVVGAPYHRTPVFSADMTYVVFNPYWNVPPSIARQELLPKIKENPGYLAEHDFDLLSGWHEDARILDPNTIDWSRVSAENFAYRLRQGPGDGNALGRIKFMLPNQFNVYLHDTPAKSLFARAERSFSHGCIRVADPDQFGAVILGRQDGWDLAAVRAAIETGERRIVTLETPIRVHITYLTAWVDKDGTVNFRNDVYGRDALLAEALLGPRAVRG